MLKSINKILSNTVVMVMVIVLSIFYIFITIKPIFGLQDDISERSDQYNYLNAENESLNQTLDNINDDQTRQRMARELYLLSDDGEILFRFPENHEN